jgi:hypothetical protein
MKIHAARYALTAALGVFAACATMISLDSLGLFRFWAAIILSGFVGLFCYATVPYHDNGRQ